MFNNSLYIFPRYWYSNVSFILRDNSWSCIFLWPPINSLCIGFTSLYFSTFFIKIVGTNFEALICLLEIWRICLYLFIVTFLENLNEIRYSRIREIRYFITASFLLFLRYSNENKCIFPLYWGITLEAEFLVTTNSFYVGFMSLHCSTFFIKIVRPKFWSSDLLEIWRIDLCQFIFIILEDLNEIGRAESEKLGLS